MARTLSLAVLLLCVTALVLPAGAFAGEEKDKPLTLASDERVKEALAEFKVNYKAKGIPKEDKIMQRDFAMQQIAKLQHPDVVAALGKVSRSGDSDLRMCAIIYLGEQKALPHLAAKHILTAMKKNKKDVALLLTGLQSLGSLKYLGARDELGDLLKHRDYAVKKEAIMAVGFIEDIRMLKELMRLLGMKVDTEGTAKESTGTEKEKSEGGKEVVEEGYSWEGAEAVVDRGEADNTQENADAKKQAEAQIAKNKAAAAAAAGKGGDASGGPNPSGIGGGGGSQGGRGGSSRSTDELIPHILRTLKRLTGEEFKSPSNIKKWLSMNQKAVEKTVEELDKKEKEQKEAK